MTRSIQGAEWKMRVDSDGKVQLTFLHLRDTGIDNLLEARLTPEQAEILGRNLIAKADEARRR